MTILYRVAVNTPFNHSILTYSSEEDFARGTLVEVPLGKNRIEKGCILGLSEEDVDKSKIKDIKGRFESELILGEEHLAFLEWVAQYYHYPVGQHIFDVLPKEMKRPKEVDFLVGRGEELTYMLTDEQSTAVNAISKALGSYKKFLLHGVTGSGKTTVYIELLKKVLDSGKNALFLIPEINLTPQFLKVLEEHVSGKILSYHSSVTNSEKHRTWQLINENADNYIMIGVRSSIFLPYKDLGLIIVDEEHDQSFKQEDRCSYHARDIAIKLAYDKKIPIILGSATPTVESYFNAQKEEGSYLRMANRPKDLELPNIEIIDSRGRETRESEAIWPFTDKGLEEIKARFQKGEQVLVFVNRLGFASFVQCRSCGQGFDCPNCSTSLKYFKKTNSLNCQYCEYKIPLPENCPSCGNMKLLQKGFGTEKLEEVLRQELPKARIDRFDRDNIKNFDALKTILNDFQEKKLDILVGTQMLSKGHNFNSVNLVVVLGIDSQLNFPDFRSNERVFQMLTQVAGRPGRSEMQGSVMIETLSPENRLFELVKNYGWKDFYDEEFMIREALGNPPFARLSALYFSSRFRDQAQKSAEMTKTFLSNIKNKHFQSIEILGPRPLFIEKRANKFTWSLLIKTSNINDLHGSLSAIQDHLKFHQSVSVKIDVDPQHLS